MLAVLLALGAVARGQLGIEQPPPRPEASADDKAAEEARKAHHANLTQYKGNADVLVLPGLLADRKTKQVRIWAKATGIGYGEPLEFFLIPPDSGKDYESAAVAFVKPSDVHRALEFVGMKPGRPVNFPANQFWPKGERVLMTFQWDQPAGNSGGNPGPVKARAEDLVVSARTGKNMARTGLVFTGSLRIKPEDLARAEMYAADVVDPRSIASNFNCRVSVLDVPRQAVQGDVYGMQKLNSAYRFTPGQSVQVVLEPEYKDGKIRVVDLSLKAEIGARDEPGIAGLKFDLKDAAGKILNDGPTLVHVLAALNKIVERGQDPFLTVQIDEKLTVSQAIELYKVLGTVDGEDGARIEAPPDGDLYYRAFFPRGEWRDRKNRLGRPWELHLSDTQEQAEAKLILPADEIDNNQGMGDLKFTVNSGAEAAELLAEKSDRFSLSICVFVPGKLTCGQMMAFLRPGMKTHPTVYVFLR